MPSPSLAHTPPKIYISSPSFTASACFKIKPIWLSDVRFVPMTKGHWCQSLYLYRHPNIFLMCNPCHLCLLASPFHLMCSFDTNAKRSHGSCPAITPHFFYKNDTLNSVGQPKGTSSREVKLVLWRAYHLHFIHFPLSVSTCRVWLSSTIVCPLKEDGLPTSLAAT